MSLASCKWSVILVILLVVTNDANIVANLSVSAACWCLFSPTCFHASFIACTLMDLLRLSVKTTSSVLAGLFWGGFAFAGFCGGVGVAGFCLGAAASFLAVGFEVGAVIGLVVGVLFAAGTMTVLESTTGNVLFSGIVASKRQGNVKRPFKVVVSSLSLIHI